MQNDYREIIKRKYEERCQANPQYSLRSFAKNLGIDRSSLSDVLRGKQGLSEKKAVLISEKLGFSKQEKDYFLALVLASDGRSKSKRIDALKKLSELNNNKAKELSLEYFQIISDWYHYAILELTETRNFKSDVKWIAKRLGINLHQAKMAIGRLIKIGLLKKENNTLKQTEDFVTTTRDIPSKAIKNFNKQILEKAIHALSLQTLEERDFATLTFSIPKSTIPEVKDELKKVREQLENKIIKLQKSKPDEVYHLSFQLFKLTEEI